MIMVASFGPFWVLHLRFQLYRRCIEDMHTISLPIKSVSGSQTASHGLLHVKKKGSYMLTPVNWTQKSRGRSKFCRRNVAISNEVSEIRPNITFSVLKRVLNRNIQSQR